MMTAMPEAMVAALAEELERAPEFVVEVAAPDLLQLVCFLQLALRCPSLEQIPMQATQRVRDFVSSSRRSFEGFPIVQMVIDMNDGKVAEPTTN